MSIGKEKLEALEAIQITGFDEGQVVAALDAVRESLQIIEARIEQLSQAAIRARKEEQLLESLLALHRGEEAMVPSRDVFKDAHELSAPRHREGPRNGVADAAVDLLIEAGRPLHVGELMSGLVKRGVRIPGAGNQANLIAHLRRDNRIARPSRGIYGLRVQGIEDYEPKKRGGRRRRRGRSKARKL